MYWLKVDGLKGFMWVSGLCHINFDFLICVSRFRVGVGGTEGQYCGKMLAETGSFDILFVYWVLGIGFFHIYINIYIYIHIHLVLGIYIIENGRLRMMSKDGTWSVIMKQHMAKTKAQYQYA